MRRKAQPKPVEEIVEATSVPTPPENKAEETVAPAPVVAEAPREEAEPVVINGSNGSGSYYSPVDAPDDRNNMRERGNERDLNANNYRRDNRANRNDRGGNGGNNRDRRGGNDRDNRNFRDNRNREFIPPREELNPDLQPLAAGGGDPQNRPQRRNLFDMASLGSETLEAIRERAKEFGISSYIKMKKDDLIIRLLRVQAERNGLELRGGIIDVVDDNIGFLRAEHYLPGPDDIYVSPSQIKRFGLRTGDMVVGQVRPPKDSEKFYSLLRVEAVNGQDPEQAKSRPHFEKLTPIFPEEIYDLEQSGKLSMRLLNIVAPIGKGQRGLIVAPPKVGKTTILKDIANAISQNYKDTHLMIALIAERPEEATDMDRSVDAEVISSTFDEPVQNHVRVAEMVLARAKRLVECGRDVVILLDSLTRLARAYNLTVPSSGRTLSGGVDPAALYPPKEFFGAARNIEEGGSLTIIATVLVDTGSKMDDMIFEEFKGTGNMEVRLNRRLADRRVFPAFDINESGTRREELLLGEKTVQRTYLMRRMLNQLTQSQQHGGAGYDVPNAMELILARFAKTKSNDEFLAGLGKES